MPTSATQLLWEAAGRPPAPKGAVIEGAAETPCYLCGAPALQPVPLVPGLAPTFGDHDRCQAPWSPVVCSACAWATAGRPPATLRLWSVAYRSDAAAPPSADGAPLQHPAVWCGNKADLSPALRLLLDPPETGTWFVALADSGQIHVVPFAPVNIGGARTWAVLWERLRVDGDASKMRHLLWLAERLYLAGFSKEEILSGEPKLGKVLLRHQRLWREVGALLQRWRGGALLQLAVWLMRREPRDDGVCDWRSTSLG